MAFLGKKHSQVVDDTLTQLTGGVVGETVLYNPSSLKYELGDSSKEISKVTIVYSINQEKNRKDFVPDIDYYLESPNILVFKNSSNLPEDNSIIHVNYYLENINPAITDRNVGSIARTIVEVFSREIATLYSELNSVYESAFLDTASGKSLDMLVSILGIKRVKAGYATGIVHFKRNTPAPADITIPATTLISDLSEEPTQYLTTEEKILRNGQIEVKVPIRAILQGEKYIAKAATLVLMPKPILGIEKVENPAETMLGTSDETDEELRARAKRAITGNTTATKEAIFQNLKGIPQLNSINIIEMPKGVNGKVDIVVDTNEDFDVVKEKIHEVLSRVKPAGVYINVCCTKKVYPAYTFDIIPASPLSEDEISKIKSDIEDKFKEYFQGLNPGENMLAKRLISYVLSIDKVYDIRFNPTSVKLFDEKSALLSDRVLLNGDIYIDTSEKVTFKEENLSLNLSAEQESIVPQEGAAEVHLIFLDVSISVRLLREDVALKQVKKIVEGKSRLFFDSLIEENRYLLKDFLNSIKDDDPKDESGRKYEIVDDKTSLRAIHSKDGLIVNLNSENDIDEIRKGEEIQILSIEITPVD